jgi:hypothetical protein
VLPRADDFVGGGGGNFMGSVSDWYPLSDELIRVIPEPVCTRRCVLLPLILEEWHRCDLPDHLSMKSRAIDDNQIGKLEAVRDRARELQEALKAIGENGRTALLAEMTNRSGSLDKSRSEFKAVATWLEQERTFLEKLVAIEPRDFWKLKRGRPPNRPAYLVLQDAAAIFEWLSSTEATREVNRDDGTEIGPFFHFASTLWPTVFGNGVVGLPAAMKNWADWRSAYNEQSALIGNLALRHPAWGIFER